MSLMQNIRPATEKLGWIPVSPSRLAYVLLFCFITNALNGRNAITRAAVQSLENQIWNSWLATSMKLKLYNTCILPAFLYRSDCWAMSKTDARRIWSMRSTGGMCVCCWASNGTNSAGGHEQPECC